MCCRYTRKRPTDDIYFNFNASAPDKPVEDSYNVAPGQQVMAICESETAGQNTVIFPKWGLIPSWSKDPSIAEHTMNAKAETLNEKPSFRTPFKKKRCVLIADGFYEWKATDSGKTPYYIRMKDGSFFCFAGLFDDWTSPEGLSIRTCTLITTEPNSLMAGIHNRMPVILDIEPARVWISRDSPVESLSALLTQYPSEKMEAYPVTKLVNSVKNNSPECIKSL